MKRSRVWSKGPYVVKVCADHSEQTDHRVTKPDHFIPNRYAFCEFRQELMSGTHAHTYTLCSPPFHLMDHLTSRSPVPVADVSVGMIYFFLTGIKNYMWYVLMYGSESYLFLDSGVKMDSIFIRTHFFPMFYIIALKPSKQNLHLSTHMNITVAKYKVGTIYLQIQYTVLYSSTFTVQLFCI